MSKTDINDMVVNTTLGERSMLGFLADNLPEKDGFRFREALAFPIFTPDDEIDPTIRGSFLVLYLIVKHGKFWQ